MAHKFLISLVFLTFVFNYSNSQPALSCPIKCQPDQICLPSPSGTRFACVDNQAKALSVGTSPNSKMMGLMPNSPMPSGPIPNGQMAPIQSARMNSGPINAPIMNGPINAPIMNGPINTPIMNGPIQNSQFSSAVTHNAPMSGAPIRMGNTNPTQNGPIQNSQTQNRPMSGGLLSSAPINQPPVPVQNLANQNGFIPSIHLTETSRPVASGSPVKESLEREEEQMPPQTPQNQQSSNFDPCLTNPCSFGNLCIRTSFGFKCQKEVDLTPEISDAREVYRMLEDAYKKGITLNMDTIKSVYGPIRVKTPDNSIIQLKVKRPNSNSTESNACLETDVCEEGTECQVNDESETGFVCVKKEEQLITGDGFTQIVVKTDEPSVQGTEQTLNDNAEQTSLNNPQEIQMSQETQMAQEPITPDTIDMICRNRSFSDRVPHPEDNHKFILCLKNGHYTVMSCPDRLVFNIYLDRCDETNEPLSSGCDSMPCQYGAKCINLANDAYKCECPPGYFGINCERAPDPCASNPCGNDGFCHSMPNSSPIPYYCTCHDQRAFGMSCDASSEKNPCINNDDESVGTIFQTKIDPNVYVHCHEHRIHLKYCIRKMVQTDDHECIWLDLNKKRSPRRKIVNKSNRKRHSSSL